MARWIAASFVLLAAQAPAAAEQSDRYTLERSDDGGFVRMDRRPGEMSICEERPGQLVCKLAADDRVALDEEIERLQDSVKALEGRVAALEQAAPSVRLPALPSDEEVEQTLGYKEKFFRRFVDIMRDLDSDAPVDRAPAPDRT